VRCFIVLRGEQARIDRRSSNEPCVWTPRDTCSTSATASMTHAAA
jgi:hypothetical protein